LAILLAVAGLIVYLVYEFEFKEKPKDPMQEFIYGQKVRDAGLFMEVTAADYIDVIPPKDGNISYAGLSFKSSAGKLIHVDSSIPKELKVDMIDECTYVPDSVWSLSTDYSGISSIWTSLKGSTLLLSALDDQTVTVLPLPDKYTMVDGKPVPVPPDVYKKKVAQQQWSIDMVSCADDRRTASCMIRNGLNYLKQATGRNVLALSTGTADSLWTLDMQQVGPSPFSYMALGDEIVWPLTTDNLDEHIFPVPINPYTSSHPLKWSVSPPFPPSSNLELVVGSDTVDDGTIRTKQGAFPGLMPAEAFTVQSTVTINSKTFTVTAKVKIEITAPDDDGANEPNLKMPPNFEDNTINVEDDGDDLWPMTDLSIHIKHNLATPLFLLSQLSSIPFLQDPVIKMFINLMQKATTGKWVGGEYKSTFFPNLAHASPNTLTVPALRGFDYRGAISAFVAKAAYNADSGLRVSAR
jgi:hypothetical protein